MYIFSTFENACTKSGIWQLLSIRCLCVLSFDFAMWLGTFLFYFPLSSVFLLFYFFVPSAEFFRKRTTFFDIPLVDQLYTQTLVAFYKVWVGAASSWISNKLGNIYPICRWSWYIATKVGEIYNFKIKIVSFVIDSGTEMTVYVKLEV